MPRYICNRWPFLKIGTAVAFHAGEYETDDPGLISLIERSSDFGLHIHLKDAPPTDESAGEPTDQADAGDESPADADQPTWEPSRRLGRRGSRG